MAKSKTTIYFGTNRNVLTESPAKFGDVYNAGAPYYYRIGKVEVEQVAEPWAAPDTAFRCGQPVLFGETPGADGKTPVLGSTQAFDALRELMRTEQRDVLIFLHGFASTFESAMERAAELRQAYLSPGTDPDSRELGGKAREPLVFAFSWPSDGVTVGLGDTGEGGRKWAYASDREDARASGLAIARCAIRLLEYLSQLAREDMCRQRVHLVAHSMGNWALRNAVAALVQLAAESNVALRQVFDNVFLMAADIDHDELEPGRPLAPILTLGRRVHVYHAENDSALSLSDIKPNHARRLGHMGPARLGALEDRVSAIDCAGVSWTPSIAHVRHQYYRLAPEVIRDVRAVLAETAATEMPWRTPTGLKGGWRIKLDAKAREKLGKG